MSMLLSASGRLAYLFITEWLTGHARSDMAACIKDYLCLNQGEYLEFREIVAEKHRNLRLALVNVNNDQSDPSLETLDQKVNELQTYLEENFLRTTVLTFKISQSIFRAYKGGPPIDVPRVCIKAFLRSEGQEYVKTLFRDGPRAAYDPPDKCTLASSNTANLRVNTHGEPYICGNIPNLAVTGEYTNPRFTTQGHVATYRRGIFRTIIPNHWLWTAEKRWQNCWRPVIDEGSPGHIQEVSASERSCYKSTMVLPITLRGNDSLGELFEKMSTKSKNIRDLGCPIETLPPDSEHTAEDYRSLIYGLLCFDHTQVGYFKENQLLDISLGMIFADMLSFFFVTRMTYTWLSETYVNALKKLGREAELGTPLAPQASS